LVFGSLAIPSWAADQTKKKEVEAAAPKPAPGQPALNACGCYEVEGACRCVKKSKCGCEGSCEPAGCEEKRNRELDKQTHEELKRQQEEDKRRNADLEKKRAEMEREEAEKSERGLRGGRPVEQK
jgi:hypothetical protein